MKIHSEERHFPCEECGKAYAPQVSATYTCSYVTVLRETICLECGKGFRQIIFRECHEHSHRKQTLSVQTTFKTPTVLSSHETIHTGEKPFLCLPSVWQPLPPQKEMSLTTWPHSTTKDPLHRKSRKSQSKRNSLSDSLSDIHS